MPQTRRLLVPVLLAALVLCPFALVSILLGVHPAAATSNSVVISQVYGGGGNSGSVYTNDFIEVFNRGNNTVSLNGWSVQYASATGSSWSVTALGNINIPPGGYVLIQEGGGISGTTPLPTPDVFGTHNLAADKGKVALVLTTTALAITNPVGLPQVTDLVGYGSTASAYEGAGPAPAPSNNVRSVMRAGAGCTDTDNNSADFSASVNATPRNSSSPLNICESTATPTNTSTATHTPTPTDTPTATFTPSITPTPSDTPT
ncbi:MAG: lamin tail domain-containing protein, partial [Chloroflexi bacterium]|nr:lamin tail domain-containing protein [Chloroflexota bacterium]